MLLRVCGLVSRYTVCLGKPSAECVRNGMSLRNNFYRCTLIVIALSLQGWPQRLDRSDTQQDSTSQNTRQQGQQMPGMQMPCPQPQQHPAKPEQGGNMQGMGHRHVAGAQG